MQSAIDSFRSNVQRARVLIALYSSLRTQLTAALDLTDILRASLVMGVSALDYYVHEVVRLGMLEAYRTQRPHTESFQHFEVSMASVFLGTLNPTNEQWFDGEIRQRHGWQSFEHPDRIADAIRLISDVSLWSEVASGLGITVPDAKERLKLIVDRRNKITHEADMDPSYPDSRWPIDEMLVSSAIDFVESVALRIHTLVA